MLVKDLVASLSLEQFTKLHEFQVSQCRAMWQPEGDWSSLMLLCCVIYLETSCVGQEYEECKINALLCLFSLEVLTKCYC